MEDGLESNYYSINLDKKCKNEKKEVYVYINDNEEIAVITNIHYAEKISREKKCIVTIYRELEPNMYKPSNHYYKNGQLCEQIETV